MKKQYKKFFKVKNGIMTYLEFEKDCPQLSKLIQEKIIRLNGSEYFGVTFDGLEVNLGMRGYEGQIEAYLNEFPSPDFW